LNNERASRSAVGEDRRSWRRLAKKSNQCEFVIRSETGELYLLNKQESVLTIEVLKMTLATEAGRGFLLERFGKEGLKIAVSLLEEMGVQIIQKEGQKSRTVS
jgi:hypothetical protein